MLGEDPVPSSFCSSLLSPRAAVVPCLDPCGFEVAEPCWAGVRNSLSSPPPLKSSQELLLEPGSALGRKPSSVSEKISTGS